MPIKDETLRRQRQREYNKRYYEKNQQAQYERIKKRRNDNAAWFYELKKTLVCHHCGEDHPACIDLHHVISDGKKNKDDTPSKWATARGMSRERILHELQTTCVPLCANCHRKVHAMHRELTNI